MTSHRLKTSFVAKDGNARVIVYVFVETTRLPMRNEPAIEMDGPMMLRLADNQPVNYLEKGKYQVVATGRILTSDDPEAL